MPKRIIPRPTRFFFIGLILAFYCPYGRINDPYPGQCNLYIDTNNNQICDRSEPAPKGEQSSLLLFSLFVVSILAAYFLTRKFLKPRQFHFLWNLVLLATFLPVGATGILLFLNVRVPNFQFWHNQLGVVFVVVGLLHFLERLDYFKQVLNNKIKAN